MRSAGHAEYMKRNEKFSRKILSVQPLGRPRRRRENNGKTYLGEIRCKGVDLDSTGSK
jgi:hypothetical protein